jgi:hypothetical protein
MPTASLAAHLSTASLDAHCLLSYPPVHCFLSCPPVHCLLASLPTASLKLPTSLAVHRHIIGTNLVQLILSSKLISHSQAGISNSLVRSRWLCERGEHTSSSTIDKFFIFPSIWKGQKKLMQVAVHTHQRTYVPVSSIPCPESASTCVPAHMTFIGRWHAHFLSA